MAMDRGAGKKIVDHAKTHTVVAQSAGKKCISRERLLASKLDTFTKELNSLVHMTVAAVLLRQTNMSVTARNNMYYYFSHD